MSMTPEEFERERQISAETLARVVEGVRGPEVARTPESVLGPVEAVNTEAEAEAMTQEETPRWNPPPPPDLGPVNASWQTSTSKQSGVLSSLLDGSRDRDRVSQMRFNADQVQLDNHLVQWTAEHFAATHRHFDGIIDAMQKRMDDIDTRHRELERELVRHVHAMARRIDVVLGEGEKGRVSHESALRAIRERLRELEEKLR